MKAVDLAILVVSAWGIAACGAPPPEDPRDADLVVDSPELTEAVLQAASWWYRETESAVTFNVVEQCRGGRVCVRIKKGPLPESEAGLTSYPIGRPETCTTTIAETLPPALEGINLAHELGHVLRLGHTDGVMTPRIDEAVWALPSEWNALD